MCEDVRRATRDINKQVLEGPTLDTADGAGGAPVVGVTGVGMSFLLQSARASAASSLSMVQPPLSRYVRVDDLRFVNFPRNDILKALFEEVTLDEAITTPSRVVMFDPFDRSDEAKDHAILVSLTNWFRRLHTHYASRSEKPAHREFLLEVPEERFWVLDTEMQTWFAMTR